MEGVLKQLKAIASELDGPGIRQAEVRAAWRRVAGEDLSSYTVVLGLDGKAALTVGVANETWRRQLVQMSPQIIFGLNADLGQGTVKRVEFCIDEAKVLAGRRPVQAAENREFVALARNEITPEIADAANSIHDAGLRERFLAAAGGSLLRKKKMEDLDKNGR